MDEGNGSSDKGSSCYYCKISSRNSLRLFIKTCFCSRNSLALVSPLKTLIFDLAASERTGLLVKFHIDLEFYYQDYDWGIVYRYKYRTNILCKLYYRKLTWTQCRKCFLNFLHCIFVVIVFQNINISCIGQFINPFFKLQNRY